MRLNCFWHQILKEMAQFLIQLKLNVKLLRIKILVICFLNDPKYIAFYKTENLTSDAFYQLPTSLLKFAQGCQNLKLKFKSQY